MENLNDVVIRYYQAYFELSNIISEKAKGDWGKADLLINNDDQVRQVFERMNEALSNFKESTSAGKLYQVSSEFVSLCDLMLKSSNNSSQDASVSGFLEHIYWDWEGKTETGDVEDLGIVEALDAFFSLPNYDPDSWLKRKFLIQGVRISSDLNNLPKKVELGFGEACACFIYGHNMASSALARSVMEAALKDKFILFKNLSLGEIVHKAWFKIEYLKKYPELNTKAKKIWAVGNEALHNYGDKKVSQLMNELNARTALDYLQKILENFYG